MADWGYEDYNGPATWPQKYPQAGGRKQSPIDIQTSLVKPWPELKAKPLVRRYEPQVCKSILNTGCGWRVDVEANSDKESDLINGPLEHLYKLVQFHSHWGNVTDCGSEHTVDGKSFAGELHFVHWNKDVHSCCADAVSANKGLAVIAVFLEVGEANPEIEKICDTVKSIPFRDQRCDIPADFDPSFLFPADQSYWTYDGSLTTPPCFESVTWIVMKHPITVSEEQLECFRSINCQCEGEDPPEGKFNGKVKLNYRPPQDLNERLIRECSYT